MQGGNAVDAAVTCAFVQSVVSPQMCGIGGYLILTLGLAPDHPAHADPGFSALDAPALAGSRVTPDMWEDAVLRPNPDGWGYFLRGKVNDIGYRSICVPGTVKGLATMLERWGTISWVRAIAPAARIAEGGFVVDAHLGAGWKAKAAYPEACSPLDRIRANAEARRIYLKDGAPYEPGMEALRRIVYTRASPDLFADGVVDRLCAFSGGHTRDLVRLVRYACDKTEEPPITREHAQEACQELSRAFERWLTDADMQLLQKLAQDPDKEIDKDDEHKRLLFHTAILSYRNQYAWYEVHPAIRALPKFERLTESEVE